MDESLDQLLVMNISLSIPFTWNQFLQNKNKHRQTIDSSNILNVVQSPMQKYTFPLKIFNKKLIFNFLFSSPSHDDCDEYGWDINDPPLSLSSRIKVNNLLDF
jgi:hypothetical protein